MLEQLGVIDCRSKKTGFCCKALSNRNNTVARGALNIKAKYENPISRMNVADVLKPVICCNFLFL